MGPTISVGMAQHHLAFPGSITLRPSTLIACVSDYVESVARHGFDAIYFLNGHGGNIATLTAAFSEIHAHASLGRTERRVRLNLTNWWDGAGVRQASRELFAGIEGSHATPSQISLRRPQSGHAQRRRLGRGSAGNPSSPRTLLRMRGSRSAASANSFTPLTSGRTRTFLRIQTCVSTTTVLSCLISTGLRNHRASLRCVAIFKRGCPRAICPTSSLKSALAPILPTASPM